ncbi:yippee-like protein, partial [Macrolepiota fuliginosa MF-IS2]
IVCRGCMNCITSSESLLPSSAVPPGSRAFRGFSGKASLFVEVYNVTASVARVQLMTTGAHTMQEIFCTSCSVSLGWKIVKAHERSERWKEGKWLLELENL